MTLRPEPYLDLADERVYAALDVLRATADNHGAGMAAVAFAWLAADGRVSPIVVGPRTPGHLDAVREAMWIELSAAERADLGAAFDL
jgi:aryl-alcohol dehydrogenase-like predicted oxidoreductase